MVVDGEATVVACNGGVAPRLDVHNAIALGIHAVHGNAARCTHVHARGPHQLGVVPVVVGKACCRLRHLQGVGVDVDVAENQTTINRALANLSKEI